MNDTGLLNEYEIFPEEVFSLYKTKFPKARDLIIDNESVRFEVARELFSREWDFFFVLFSGSDWISHRAFADMLSGEGPKAKGARQYFNKLDEWIGWFFDNAEPGTLKMIISDHGFKVCKGSFAIDSWLEQKGFLAFKEGKGGGGESLPFMSSPSSVTALSPIVWRAHDTVAGNRLTAWSIPILKRVFMKLGKINRLVASDLILDLESSSAINAHDGIFVREDIGEGRDTVDKLIKGLNGLREQYGVFREAARREDIYWGPHVGLAPAITLIDSDYYPKKSYNVGRKDILIDGPVSWHDKDGVWVLSGLEGVAGRGLDASLMDVYPTVLEWMGVEPAHRPDGTSLLGRLEVR